MEEGRDYLAEMDQLIDAATEGSGWVPAVLAGKLYAELLEADTDLLDGWLDAMARDTLRRVITARTAAARQRERTRTAAGRFAQAARDFEGGNPDAFAGMFAVLHTVSPDGIRRYAGEMTGGEHQYVAEGYHARGTRTLMLAAFHRAVADRVGIYRTDEVMPLEEYERLYRSIARDDHEGETI